MKLDQATAVLRPRSAWEAVDLGLALCRRHWGRLMHGWLTVALPLWAIIIFLCRDYPGWACFLIWLTKPVLTRQPVYYLSRALFGQPPCRRGFWRDWKVSLWKGLLPGLTIRRLSYQRSFRLPVIMLEGQQGRGYNQRVNVLGAHGGGSASSLAFAGLVLQLVITLGLAEYVGDFINENLQDSSASTSLFGSVEFPPWLAWLWTGFFAASIALIEPFYAAAGFALYINSRTHLEGWDIEVAFRRMSLRLAPAAVAALLLLFGGIPATSRAAETPADPKSVVQEVLKSPDFELEKYKVPKTKMKPDDDAGKGREIDPEALGSAGTGYRWVGYLIIAAVVFVVAWLLWKNRTALRWTKREAAVSTGPRVVMGMDLAPESLPDDIPQTAWKEFQAGRPVEALRLLYRGSLAWLVNRASLPVHESDTEGDCLRHAQSLTDAERVSFFEFLTSMWINCAYAGEAPEARPMKHLCDNWPFSLRQRSSAAASPVTALTLLLTFPISLLVAGCKPSEKVEYEEKISGYKGAAAINPWLAATRMLERMGLNTETRQSLGTMPGVHATMFIPAESVASRGSAIQVLEWASNGGHLVVACSDTDRFRNDWRDAEPFEPDYAMALLQELDVALATEDPALFNKITFQDGESATLQSTRRMALNIRWHNADLLAGSEESAVLASFSYRLGRVTLLASAAPFRNRFIENSGNAAILYNLVTLDYARPVIFVFSGKTSLWSMLMEYAWMPLAATVLLIALWLWRHLPRFGPALPADQSAIRHFGTQLDENGKFLSDRAGHDALLASARRSVMQAAAQRGIHGEGQNFEEHLSARTGVPVADIQDALHNHSDSGNLIAAAATLQKLQHSLGVTL